MEENKSQSNTAPELKLLLVEDSEDDALLLLREVKKGGYQVVHERVYTEADMKKAITEKKWDILISDYIMPGFSGTDALRILKEHDQITPFILTSNKLSEEQAVDIMRKGANDFITKQNLSRLVPAIKRELDEAKTREKNIRIGEELRANHALLDRVFSSIHVLIAYMDDKFNFIRVNLNYAKANGHDQDFFVGKNYFDLYPDSENEAIFKNVVETKQPYVAFEKPFTNKEFPERGVSYLDWNLQPVLEEDRTSGLIISLIDVNERVRDREKVRESEIRFKALFNSANDAIFIHKLNGNIIEVNEVACERLKYSYNELIAKNMADIYVSETYGSSFAHLIAMAEKGTALFESAHRTKTGEIIPIEVSARSIQFEKETVILSIVRDITERKKYESELVKAKELAEEASKAKSEFLTNMSHEIRTPMNSIVGMADLLAETNPTQEQSQYIEIFREAGDHLLSLINDILDISRVESGSMLLEKGSFDPAKSIRKTWDMLSVEGKKKNLELALNIPSDMPALVKGDQTKFERVLINIIGNAMKFTSKGGVRVDIDQNLLPENKLELSFRIQDTGIGIPADKQDMLFHKFTQLDATSTRQYGGTGLGLVISKKLIELMGGNIRLESELGKGSTFYFTLKFKIDKAIQLGDETTTTGGKETVVETSEHPDGAKNVDMLLVEDSFDNRRLIELYLKKLPYTIDTAENGAIAVEKFKSKRYSIVLMDIQMPVMDGYAATQEIRRWEKENKMPPTPVLALTANAFKEDEENCYKSGCDMFISKPVKKVLLLETIEKLLSKKHEG